MLTTVPGTPPALAVVARSLAAEAVALQARAAEPRRTFALLGHRMRSVPDSLQRLRDVGA
ncbi:hypothetical protein ACIQI7_14885 [Kitasatospora sp. NPDC092039]|uniref:hypothetical protein n=1 Tax=Kitasatospora sp. NPDC092039 TaxID=3364086 RepID=UPI00381D154B